jgi:hypothetical protein
MKFLRLGIIAAMAMALCGQQALAADAPAGASKIDPKNHDQSMKDAPPLVLASGLKCDVTDAYLLGVGNETVNGKKITSTFYELACGQGGMGYIFKSVAGGDPTFYDCLSLKTSADKAPPPAAAAAAANPKDKKAAAAQPSTTSTCGTLPENADPKSGLLTWLTQGGANCSAVDKGAWLGSSPTDKINVFEASCAGGNGYLIIAPLPGSTKPLDVEPCIKSDLLGVKCTLTSPQDMIKPILAVADNAKHASCMPNRARWVVTDATNGNEFYELGCADGASAYIIRTSAKGEFREAIDCTRATRIAGGCTFMNVNTGQTADNATYTKLAKQIGYDACPTVQKYQSYGTENKGPREIVELSCGPNEGAYALVPTGAGQTGEYFNCVRASGLGLTCHLTPMEATYAKISQQIAARGKTTCAVSGGRDIGKDDKGQEYVEVTCGAQPSLVLTYSRLPQETLVGAVPCAQAPIANACTLKK